MSKLSSKSSLLTLVGLPWPLHPSCENALKQTKKKRNENRCEIIDFEWRMFFVSYSYISTYHVLNEAESWTLDKLQALWIYYVQIDQQGLRSPYYWQWLRQPIASYADYMMILWHSKYFGSKIMCRLWCHIDETQPIYKEKVGFILFIFFWIHRKITFQNLIKLMSNGT